MIFARALWGRRSAAYALCPSCRRGIGRRSRRGRWLLGQWWSSFPVRVYNGSQLRLGRWRRWCRRRGRQSYVFVCKRKLRHALRGRDALYLRSNLLKLVSCLDLIEFCALLYEFVFQPGKVLAQCCSVSNVTCSHAFQLGFVLDGFRVTY